MLDLDALARPGPAPRPARRPSRGHPRGRAPPLPPPRRPRAPGAGGRRMTDDLKGPIRYDDSDDAFVIAAKADTPEPVAEAPVDLTADGMGCVSGDMKARAME